MPRTPQTLVVNAIGALSTRVLRIENPFPYALDRMRWSVEDDDGNSATVLIDGLPSTMLPRSAMECPISQDNGAPTLSVCARWDTPIGGGVWRGTIDRSASGPPLRTIEASYLGHRLQVVPISRETVELVYYYPNQVYRIVGSKAIGGLDVSSFNRLVHATRKQATRTLNRAGLYAY